MATRQLTLESRPTISLIELLEILLPPRLPVKLPMLTTLQSKRELLMRRINSREDKTRTERDSLMRTIRLKCPESRTSTIKERVPTADSRRLSLEIIEIVKLTYL